MNTTKPGTAKLYLVGAKRRNKWRFKVGVTEQVDVQNLLNRYPELNEKYKCNVWASAFLPEDVAYNYANKLYKKYPVDESIEVAPIGGVQLRDIPVKAAIRVGQRIRDLNKVKL